MPNIEKGQLKGAFKGFKNRDTIFEFYGGGMWRQREYHYLYHYAYMPQAEVNDINGRFILSVDGVRDQVEVVRVR
jgi:hypothetical protein